jgi:DNA-binding NarL/FixJ family response regulator
VDGERRKGKKTRPVGAAVEPPPGLEGSRLKVEGKELALLTFSMGPPSFPATLSAAERAVALALIEGLSNAEIAKTRKTSVRTVANQVVATFRKLGVHSRLDLIHKTCPRRAKPGPRDPP